MWDVDFVGKQDLVQFRETGPRNDLGDTIKIYKRVIVQSVDLDNDWDTKERHVGHSFH